MSFFKVEPVSGHHRCLDIISSNTKRMSGRNVRFGYVLYKFDRFPGEL